MNCIYDQRDGRHNRCEQCNRWKLLCNGPFTDTPTIDIGLVYHPKHYNKNGRKECWEEMIELFGPEAVIIFDVLSAYKYSYRAGEKDGNPGPQDVEKINNYMEHANKTFYTHEETSVYYQALAHSCFRKMYQVLEKGADKK